MDYLGRLDDLERGFDETCGEDYLDWLNGLMEEAESRLPTMPHILSQWYYDSGSAFEWENFHP